MMAANIPEPPSESKPTLPNESRFKKRLDHTPPFTGTVTGKVSIIESAPNQRIILVSDIKGDGIMQVLVRGNTAQKSGGEAAKPIMNAPRVLVQNTKQLKKASVPIGSEMALTSTPANVRTSLETHYKNAMPADLKIVAEQVTVK